MITLSFCSLALREVRVLTLRLMIFGENDIIVIPLSLRQLVWSSGQTRAVVVQAVVRLLVR